MKLSKAGQGERATPVNHRFGKRTHLYEGVSEELSPLFDFSTNPWMLFQGMQRQAIVAWNLIRHLGLNKQGAEVDILDVGCGYAEIYTWLKTFRMAKGTRITYTGIDLDPDKQVVAQQLRPNVDYRLKDVRENLVEFLGVAGYYEGIVCSEVIEHLDKEEGQKLVRQLWTLLMEGGIAVITVPTPELSTKRKTPYHLHEWEPEEFTKVLREQTFEILDHFSLNVNARNWLMHTPRVPNGLASAPMSCLCEPIGITHIYVVTKEEED